MTTKIVTSTMLNDSYDKNANKKITNKPLSQDKRKMRRKIIPSNLH